MNGEYGVTYPQFVLDQNYLLPRYYLADQDSDISLLFSGSRKPYIPKSLLSLSLQNYYNGGDIKAGLCYQFYLENGLDKWKQLANYVFANNLGNDNEQILVSVINKMNELSDFDYSYILKSEWGIQQSIEDSNGENIIISLIPGKGSIALTGYGNDNIIINGKGQYRIDAGDGYDTVRVNSILSSSYKIRKAGWNISITDAMSGTFISLNFVEKVSINGVDYDFSYPYTNSLAPFVKSITSSGGSNKLRNGNDIIIEFSENIYPKAIGASSTIAAALKVRNGDGAVISYFSTDSGTFIFDNDKVILKNVHGMTDGINYVIIPYYGTIIDDYKNLLIKAYDNPGPYYDFDLIGYNKYILVVNKAGNGFGTVSGGGTFPYNTTVTPTATAAAGSTFAGWTPTSCGASFALAADTTCTATFTLNNYTLTVNKTGTGNGTVGGGGTFPYNTTVTPTATAASGSTFAGWTPASCGASFALTADTICTATFNTVTLQGDVNEDGKVDALDVVAVINAVLGLQNWPRADVNGDSAVNALDVVFVINKVLGV